MSEKQALDFATARRRCEQLVDTIATHLGIASDRLRHESKSARTPPLRNNQ
jgi:hypothetical protein